MRMSKEQAKELRNAAHRSDDAIYLETQIEELRNLSKVAKWALTVSIFSLIVAIISIVITLMY